MWRALRRCGFSVVLGTASLAGCDESTRSSSAPMSGGAGGGASAGTSGAGGPIFLGGAPSFGGGPPTAAFDCEIDPPAAPVRRLSVADIDGNLEQLFGAGESLSKAFTLVEVGYYRDVSLQFVSALREVAVARAASAVPETQRFAFCEGASDPDSDATCVEDWLQSWGSRIYRRALAPEQVDAYVAQFRAAARDDSDVGAARNALVSMLLSPYFALRIEFGGGATAETLAPEELAARLSHFVIRRAPDVELLNAARRGDLASPEGMRAQYERLRQTAEARAAREQFMLEWLGLNRIDSLAGLSPELWSDMLWQLRALVSDVFEGQNDTLEWLLTTARVPINPRLAEHYGYTPVDDGKTPGNSGFANIDPALGAGILSTGAFLARYPRPTERGIAIQEALLGAQMPPVALDLCGVLGPGSTPRERVTSAVATSMVCPACHSRFDPVGFALDGFDDRGRPSGFDSSGAVPFLSGSVPVQSPRELGRALAMNEQGRTTAIRRYLELALDRRLSDDSAGDPVEPIPPEPPGLHPKIVEQRQEPDEYWLACLKGLTTGSNRLSFGELGSYIVASRGFRAIALPAHRVIAFDVSKDPVEHARQEALGFVGAFASQYDNAYFSRYAEALLELAQGKSPLGSGGEAAGGASGEGAGGAAAGGQNDASAGQGGAR